MMTRSSLSPSNEPRSDQPASGRSSSERSPFRHPPSGHAGDNARAITAMLAGMALLCSNDVLVKLASDNVATGQIILLRGLVATLLLLVFAMWRRELRRWRDVTDAMVVLRIAAEVLATVLFLLALFRMPIAHVTAILMFSPLLATAGAALFLGERVGWRRWLAALIGFSGVMLIIKPGFAPLELGSVLTMGSVLFIAIRDLATRRIRADTSTLMTTLATAAAVTTLGAVLAAFEPWESIAARDAALVSTAGLTIMFSYFLMVVAMRSGDVSLVSAFRYSVVVWAVLAGYLVWNEIPDPWTFAGIAVLIGSGLYTYRRETALARMTPLAPAPVSHPDT